MKNHATKHQRTNSEKYRKFNFTVIDRDQILVEFTGEELIAFAELKPQHPTQDFVNSAIESWGEEEAHLTKNSTIKCYKENAFLREVPVSDLPKSGLVRI